MSGAPDSPPSPWLEALDAALVARLRRPLDGAGIIPLGLVNRIIGWVQYFSGKLPLLEEAARRRGQTGGLKAGDLPIVHARIGSPPSEDVGMAAGIVERAPRVVVRASPALSMAVLPERGSAVVSAGEVVASGLARQGDEPVAPRAPLVVQAREMPAEPSPMRDGGISATRGGAMRGPSAQANSIEAAHSPEQLAFVRPSRAVEPKASLASEGALSPRPIAPTVPSTQRDASAPPQKIVVDAAMPAERGFVAQPVTSSQPRELPRVRPLGHERGSMSPAPSPARPQTIPAVSEIIHSHTETRSIDKIEARVPSTSPESFAKKAHPDAPLPRVTPSTRAASSRESSPTSPLPHVHPSGVRAAGAASPSTSPEAMPLGSMGALRASDAHPYALPAAVAEPRGRRTSAPEEPFPAAAVPAGAAPIDVDAVVDKVQRKLLRRLAAERERKGGLG